MQGQDILRIACEAEIDRQMLPVVQLSEALQLALMEYVDRQGADTRGRVQGAMMAVVGGPIEGPSDRCEAVRLQLRAALLAMLAHVDPASAVAQPESAPESLATETGTGEEPPLPGVDPDDLAQAALFFDEIDLALSEPNHPLRLHHLLQALVAECRDLMEKIPEHLSTHWQLSEAVRRLGSVRKREGVEGFIFGLSREHKANWGKLAREARIRLDRFDHDAQLAPCSTDRPTTSRKDEQDKPMPADHEWPVLPALRRQIEAGGRVVIVGGWQCNDKIQLVRDRLGLEIEWCQTDKNKPNAVDEAVSRIKGGKVVAVVVLEGLLSHKDWKRIVAASAGASVPRANARSGGIGSLEAAFVEIERQFTEAA